MIFLLLSIVCSTAIMMVFKLTEKYKVDLFEVILFNYLTCFTIGNLTSNFVFFNTDILELNWLPYAFGLGCFFIFGFFLMGITTQKSGVTVATIASKLSVVIPVFIGLFVYHESAGILKILGISLAIISVLFASYKEQKKGKEVKTSLLVLLLPLIVFVISGITDATLKYIEQYHLPDDDFALFSIILFGSAFSMGIVILIIRMITQNYRTTKKGLLFGILLGIPNYGSIYFILKAFRASGMESSVIFPINNLGIVLLSALLAIIFFKERLNKVNWIGVGLSIIAVFLISKSM